MATPYPVGPTAMPAPPGAVGGATPSSRVELYISCANLQDKDVFSKSDPIVAVYQQQRAGGGTSWTEYGRTEWIKNSLDPQFSTAIEIVYRFEEVQKLKFMVFDIDNATSKLDDDDFLGCIQCTLGELQDDATTSPSVRDWLLKINLLNFHIVSAATFTKPLEKDGEKASKKNKGKMGTITIRAEEMSQNQSRSLLDLQFSANGLDKKDFLGKSDPYLEFKKQNPDGSFSVVHRTQVVKNTLHPVWPPFQISSQTLCSNDPEKTIKVTCYDWDSDGSHDLIGEFSTSLAELSSAHSSHKKLEWACINPEKAKKKKKYKNSGTIHAEVKGLTKVYSFLDYIMGGCQVNFTVGVDFTGSNGDPSSPSSLHYIDPYAPNQYTQALLAVGQVCQDYDSDKLFPALGFGGKISDHVSHEFPLNGNPSNPYCLGIQGVVEAYHASLRTVKLWGPTNFAPIINHVAKFAAEAKKNPQTLQYFILLMLTDGAISDMSNTKLAIIAASKLPMSIIIVGVGNADFNAMDELDADERRLQVGSNVAERDIVQFVPYRNYINSSPEALASAVLAEIPQQLVDYMTKNKLTPPNAR